VQISKRQKTAFSHLTWGNGDQNHAANQDRIECFSNDPGAAFSAEVWEKLFPQERHRIAHLMIERVDLVEGGIKMKWRELGWKALIGEFTPQEIKLLEAA
jgi:hypothetical protein